MHTRAGVMIVGIDKISHVTCRSKSCETFKWSSEKATNPQTGFRINRIQDKIEEKKI